MGYAMDANEILEVLFLLTVIVLPALILWSHYSARRQAKEQHDQLIASLAGHQEQVSASLKALLEDRIPASAPTPVPAAAPAEPKREAKISEDKLMVIAAVLACHFGKRVKVRSARRVMIGGGSNVWSQQGRAAVQASHSGFR